MGLKYKHVEAHMKAAEVYASLSSAKRLKVGAIVVKDDRIISIGYNGTPSGWDNECEVKEYVGEVIGGSIFGYDYSDAGGSYKLITKPEVIHAEANAIAKLASSHESGKDSMMFVTHAPCLECAKLIHTAGIKTVFYKEKYRTDDGIDFLTKCGINVVQVKETLL